MLVFFNHIANAAEMRPKFMSQLPVPSYPLQSLKLPLLLHHINGKQCFI